MGVFSEQMAADLAGFPGQRGFSFRRHTTAGIGGAAPLALFPRDAAELAAIVRRLREAHIPHCLLGNGSNVLVSDAGLDGVAVVTKGANALSVRGKLSLQNAARCSLPCLRRRCAPALTEPPFCRASRRRSAGRSL